MLFFIAISTKMMNKTEKRVGEKGFGRIGKLLNENMFLPVRDLQSLFISHIYLIISNISFNRQFKKFNDCYEEK